MGFDLSGKTAAVAGGASGLGRSIALGLAEAGASVAILDRQAEQAGVVAGEIDPHGQRSFAIPVDVTSLDSVEAAIAEVIDRLGSIDIFVNSAGISHNDAATEIPLETWQRVLGVNLTGTMITCQVVGRHMVKQGRGSIINLASIMSFVTVPMKVAYNASKGGVAQLTKTLAVEWAPAGVRVNALAPSPFESPMFDYASAANPELLNWMRGRSAMGRPGRPEEIVGPAIFLASDASSMVTGHILPVDGGYLAR